MREGAGPSAGVESAHPSPSRGESGIVRSSRRGQIALRAKCAQGSAMRGCTCLKPEGKPTMKAPAPPPCRRPSIGFCLLLALSTLPACSRSAPASDDGGQAGSGSPDLEAAKADCQDNIEYSCFQKPLGSCCCPWTCEQDACTDPRCGVVPCTPGTQCIYESVRGTQFVTCTNDRTWRCTLGCLDAGAPGPSPIPCVWTGP